MGFVSNERGNVGAPTFFWGAEMGETVEKSFA
jgi:hypothetical protein